ncbi:Phosphoenolpyruvate/pyruvate domain-containing protein [Hymenopellis radicata]|nr:Phosphoenolpyruvate/pyruvate domain-containing protein [Hymenopellis radicata]
MDRYNALHIRQSPNLRQAIADTIQNDTALFGYWAGLPSVDVCKIVAATNVDWVVVDAEHTPLSPTLMAEMIQTLRMYSQGRIIPVVRVPSYAHDWVTWALDAGAGGIIIPHSETPAQVRASIAAVRFPPQGNRSFAPFVLFPGAQLAAPEGKTWMDVASDHCAVIPQIESGLGVENLEEILQIEGVDAIMIGPTDLGNDLDNDPKRVAEAIERIESLARQYGKPLVGFVPAERDIVDRFKAGYRLMTTVADVVVLKNGIETGIQTSRDLVENYQKEERQRLVN